MERQARNTISGNIKNISEEEESYVEKIDMTNLN